MTPTLARRAGAVTLIAATAVALTACGRGGARLTFNDTQKVKITSIVLTGHSGDVAVKTAPIDETRITRIIYRNTDPGPSYRFEGTVLHLDTSCGPDCTASYQIEAPVGVSVTGGLNSGDIALTGISTADVRVTSGDISVDGATGPVKAQATSGDIVATGTRGPLTLRATSGDLRGMDLAGGPVDVQVSSGDVELTLSTATSVTAQAHSGDVRVQVPAGDYRVNARAHSGDTHVAGLVDVPSAKNLLDLQADSGDVTVTADRPAQQTAVPAPPTPPTPATPRSPGA